MSSVPSSNIDAASAVGGIQIPPDFVPPPPFREVASGVANLGNTCYMNAALQALAHAPELCHALDAESHIRSCPVALRNERRRKKRVREGVEGINPAGGVANDAPLSDATGVELQRPPPQDRSNTKSHRRSNSTSSNVSNGSKKKGGAESDSANNPLLWDPDYEFCTLCEVERLLGRVHSRPEEVVNDPLVVEEEKEEELGENIIRDDANNQVVGGGGEGPFVPETFVSGFMSKVAPWFRRGVQEDSHEFLRLLIDAMQSSCKSARNTTDGEEEKPDSSIDDGPPSRRLRRSSSSNSSHSSGSSSNNEENNEADSEYPFRLFRGTVESNVTCSACRSTSCKVDPIEDIGLDILPNKIPARGGNGTMSSSRSSSPTGSNTLADVTTALGRFISSENLDSGYKCEKCGKLGKATKTSKLASIPPILTLHLKRFRYGSGVVKRGGGNTVSYNDNAIGGGSTGLASSRSRSSRGSTSLTQIDNIGPSGSAKIEGHVRFGAVLDMKPYLTPELQQTFKRAICRLFAVIVHTGKNSNSGHYVAFVLNVTKNEWWKMDDAKVERSNLSEVLNADAYMLFYRVTNHPVAEKLKSVADVKYEKSRMIMEEIRRREKATKAAEDAKKAEAIKAAKAAALALQEIVDKDDKVPDMAPSSDNEDPNIAPSSPALGKRACPSLASGEEWAASITTLSPEYLPLFTRIQEFITDNITFSPEFFGYITDEFNRMSSNLSIGRRVKNNKRIKTLLGKGPGGVYPPEDVVGGAVDIEQGILDLFHQISYAYNKTSGAGGFILPEIEEETVESDTDRKSDVEKIESVTPTTSSSELIVSETYDEPYDGAL